MILWANPNSKFNSQEFKQKQSDNQSKNMAKRLTEKPQSQYSNAKNGVVTIGGKTFFARSSWEANCASYFQFLKESGEIKDWQYEPKTFWFEKIKRGVRSYKPDFLITRNDGSEYYEEVKGYMDKKSATKIKRMRIYYPDISISVLDNSRYKALKKTSSLFKEWGKLDNGPIKTEFLKCSYPKCENKSFSKKLCRKHFYKSGVK